MLLREQNKFRSSRHKAPDGQGGTNKLNGVISHLKTFLTPTTETTTTLKELSLKALMVNIVINCNDSLIIKIVFLKDNRIFHVWKNSQSNNCEDEMFKRAKPYERRSLFFFLCTYTMLLLCC